MNRLRVAVPLLLLTAAAAACSGSVGPQGQRRLGAIVAYDAPTIIQAPDTVQAGEAFDLSVRTYGGGCVVSEDGTDVQAEGLVANVTPYDLQTNLSVCAENVRVFEHKVTLTFSTRGLAQIKVHGRTLPADSAVTAVRSVVVE